MSATSIPEMMRMLALERYYHWACIMRDHFNETNGRPVEPGTEFWNSEDAQHAFMYLSYWYAGLYIVCEGWQELKLCDSEIDKLLQSPYLDVLRRYRNGVFHYQQDYFDNRVKEAIGLGAAFQNWTELLMSHFNRYFLSWLRTHKQQLKQTKQTAPN